MEEIEEVEEVVEVEEVTEFPRDYELPSMPNNNIPYFQEALKMNHIIDFSEKDEKIDVNEPQQFYLLG